MALISVIIPCYNAAPFLRDTLTSVMTQTGVDLQVIVIDDGSTDESAEIVAREFPTVELICGVHQGASRARNCGLERVRGEYIQFLDADDVLFPNKFSRQHEFLVETGADIVYSDWQYLVKQAEGAYSLTSGVISKMSAAPDIALFTGSWVVNHAYLFRREIVQRVGGFREDLPIIQDARFALDCALLDAQFVYLPGFVCAYRMHRNQISRNRAAFARDCFTNARQVQEWWCLHGGISPDRRTALVQVYGDIARMSYSVARATFWDAYHALLELQPDYLPSAPRELKWAARVLGYPRAEAVAGAYRQVKQTMLAAIGRLPPDPIHSNAPR